MNKICCCHSANTSKHGCILYKLCRVTKPQGHMAYGFSSYCVIALKLIAFGDVGGEGEFQQLI